jgi:hypothetical protein
MSWEVAMHPASGARWEADNITYPRIEIVGGRRTVRDAGDFIEVNLDWLRQRHADMIRPDGLVQMSGGVGSRRVRVWTRDA